jgi:hypothetical protein
LYNVIFIKEEVDHLNESINVFKKDLDIERNVSKHLEVRLKNQADMTRCTSESCHVTLTEYADKAAKLEHDLVIASAQIFLLENSTSKPWWKLWL